VIGETEVAQFERKAYEVSEKVGGVDAAIDEDSAVNVGMREG
jgi:hypothetical protein